MRDIVRAEVRAGERAGGLASVYAGERACGRGMCASTRECGLASVWARGWAGGTTGGWRSALAGVGLAGGIWARVYCTAILCSRVPGA